MIHRDGKWFLYASVEAAKAPQAEPVNGFVGVDMGIVNIASTSIGERASGARLNRHRKRLEQLTGIRDRVRLRKPQRATLHSWAFAQLGSFLAYKAMQAGVAFVEVDPAYTSQTCSACGWVEKKNRRSQAVFECDRCRFVGHADHNAALNIASRGVERWGEVMRLYAAPTLTAS